MSTNFSSQYAQMSPQQRFDYEKKLEDSFIDGEFSWQMKKAQILREWASVLEYSVSPTSSISEYIKNRLRLRGINDEGRLAYVHETLESKYKNENLARNSSPAWRDNSDEMAEQPVDWSTLKQMSTAEQYELITKRFKKIKGTKKALTDEADLLEQFASQEKIRIPELEKLPADTPHEIWHGFSKAYYDVIGMGDEATKIGKQFYDLAKKMFMFRPDAETDLKCAHKFEQFHDNEWQVVRFMTMLSLKSIQNHMTPATDDKWAYILSDWLKAAYDKETAYGSHGSGSVHAVPTGEFVLKEYKDGRKELVSLMRETTREQMGDKTKEDILKMALIAAKNHNLEKAIKTWMDNSIIPEIMEPDE